MGKVHAALKGASWMLIPNAMPCTPTPIHPTIGVGDAAPVVRDVDAADDQRVPRLQSVQVPAMAHTEGQDRRCGWRCLHGRLRTVKIHCCTGATARWAGDGSLRE